MKNKAISLILALALAICIAPLSGCESGATKIAFFLYDASDTFITEMMNEMTSAMPDDVSYKICDAGNSQAVQNQQITELINSGYDLFVINAVDRLACSSIVEKCAQEGIPVIFFNREPLEDALSGDNVYYVGAAADSLGEKQADMVAELFSGENGEQYDKNGDSIIQLVILKGEQGHQDAEKRTDNCISRLKELGFDVETLAIEVCDWNRQTAYDTMRQLYLEYSTEIELIFANNDDMALGAIDYLKGIWVFREHADEYKQPYILVGVDGTAVGLEAIGKGLLYGTVNNDAAKQADAILTLSEYILTGKELDDYPYTITNERYIYVDGDIITLQNLSDFTMSED